MHNRRFFLLILISLFLILSPDKVFADAGADFDDWDNWGGGPEPVTTQNSDGGTTTTFSDGTTWTENPDGNIIKIRPDGTTVTINPDGTQVTTSPNDGTTTTIHPDGSRFTSGPDGVKLEGRDGTTITTTPDGTTTTQNLDGSTITKHPDGRVTRSGPTDGSVLQSGLSSQDGSVVNTRSVPQESGSGSSTVTTTTANDGSMTTTSIRDSSGNQTTRTTYSDGISVTTTQHGDYSTTTKWDNGDGTTTSTTMNSDGTRTVITTDANGQEVPGLVEDAPRESNYTDDQGNRVTEQSFSDGTHVQTTQKPDGSTSTKVTTRAGQSTVENRNTDGDVISRSRWSMNNDGTITDRTTDYENGTETTVIQSPPINQKPPFQRNSTEITKDLETGSTTVRKMDPDGNVYESTVTEADGSSSTIRTDENGNTISEFRDENGVVRKRYTLDKNGNETVETFDENGDPVLSDAQIVALGLDGDDDGKEHVARDMSEYQLEDDYKMDDWGDDPVGPDPDDPDGFAEGRDDDTGPVKIANRVTSVDVDPDDGSRTYNYEDGKKITFYLNGDQTIYDTDGTVTEKTLNADGSFISVTRTDDESASPEPEEEITTPMTKGSPEIPEEPDDQRPIEEEDVFKGIDSFNDENENTFDTRNMTSMDKAPKMSH